MKDNPFQSIIVGVFAALTVAGFIFFALIRSDGADPSEVVGNVTIWGPYDPGLMSVAIKALEDSVLPDGYSGNIIYKHKNIETYNDELVEALAEGTGPDVFMISQADVVRQINKINVIPFTSFPLRTYKDNYIEGAEVYINNEGVIGFPFTVDPLIMYWNKDILTREQIAQPPEYWDEFFDLSAKITKRDQSANILQATVPFGEYRNVTNGKSIVSALIQQAGDNIVRYNSSKGVIESILGSGSSSGANAPAASALRFYTEFSNPIKIAYSWNRALPESRVAFLSGELAFYFGHVSEIPQLRRANPNLNFDIALLPQIRDTQTPKTFGNMQAFAVSKASRNKAGAFRIASSLTAKPVLEAVSVSTALPPIRRDMLANPPADNAVSPITYKSSLITHAWLEPGGQTVDTIFRDMIESISSGRLSITEAIKEADQELNLAL